MEEYSLMNPLLHHLIAKLFTELCDNDTSGMMDDFAHELNRLMKADTKGDVLDVAYEEWVANTVSGILADPNTFNQFANRFMDEETRSTFLQLIDAIMDYIREAFDKIKTALGWRQTQALENDLNALQDIREMLFQGYETIKNRLSYADKNASYDNLFQAHETNLTETELARYNEYATNALKGPGNNSERFVPVGEVSILIKEGLRKFGIELSDNSIHEIYDNNFRHLRKSHGIETEGQYGVTNGDIYAIPYIIAHPDGVYYCETTSGKKGILYVLNDVDSTYYVESVAVDGNLSGVQMMKSPLGVIPNQYKDTIVKEKALIALPNVQDHVGSSPQLYVQDVGRDHASINNIDAQSKDVKSSVNTDVLENRAAEEFGTTYDWNETGYILTDGRRLDLSEKNNGGPRGQRSADHRIVGTLYEDLQGTAALVDFMNRGNIRIIPETGGIDISVAPNKKQLDVLDSYISKNRGEVIVDISDEQGNNLYSWEYAKGTYSKKQVAEDMYSYFAKGDMEGFQRVFDKYVEDEVSKMVEEDTKTLEETGQHKYDSTESMQNKATKAVLNKLAQQLADNEEQIAEAYLAKYTFTQKVPEAENIELKAFPSFISKYNEFCKPANVPEKAYYNVYMFEKESHGEVDSKGKSIPYSKCVKVMAYIDSLNVTAAQKTALALCYYGKSTVDNYKLW